MEQDGEVEVCATLTGSLKTIIPVANIESIDGSAQVGIGKQSFALDYNPF